MNWDQLQGKWKQYQGKAKVKWGKLTDDDLNVIDGNRQQLVGKLQEYYGITKEVAEKQTQEFADTLKADQEHAQRAGHS
ncbi:MAG: CsbD family protein [Candidatus Acidiferrales bacterium]